MILMKYFFVSQNYKGINSWNMDNKQNFGFYLSSEELARFRVQQLKPIFEENIEDTEQYDIRPQVMIEDQDNVLQEVVER